MKNLKIRILAIFLCLMTVLAAIPALTVSAAGETVEIGTAEELLAFAGEVMNGSHATDNKTYLLTADIDLNPGYTGGATAPSVKWPDRKSGGIPYFSGTFDGQGHTISGVYLNSSLEKVGMFANVQTQKSATVKNLRIVNSYFATSANNVGALFGVTNIGGSATSNHTKVTIDNVFVDATVTGGKTSGSAKIGGLIGEVLRWSEISLTNSVFAGKVIAPVDAYAYGGLIGYATFKKDDSNAGATLSVSNCAFYGSLSGTRQNYSPVLAVLEGTAKIPGTYTVDNCIIAGTSQVASPSGAFLGACGAANQVLTFKNSLYTKVQIGSDEVDKIYGSTGSTSTLTTDKLTLTTNAEIMGMTSADLTAKGLSGWTVIAGSFPLPTSLVALYPTLTCDGTSLSDDVNEYNYVLADDRGYYQNGTLHTDSRYSATNRIAVAAGETVSVGMIDPDMAVPVADFCKADGTFLSDVNFAGVTVDVDYRTHKKIVSVTVPDGAAFVRFNFNKTEKYQMLALKNQKPTLEEFFDVLDREMMPLCTDPTLYQKSAIFFGDSICYARCEQESGLYSEIAGWAGRLGVYHDMRWVNAGISGTSISNQPLTSGIIWNQVEKHKNDADYDYVILEGMTNDASVAAEVGTVTAPGTTSYDTATFAGGLEYTLSKIKEYFPDAIVGYIITYQMPNSTNGVEAGRKHNMSDYIDVAKRICSKWGVPVLDLYNDCKLNVADLANSGKTVITDGTHVNHQGYEAIYPIVENYMETIGAGLVYESREHSLELLSEEVPATATSAGSGIYKCAYCDYREVMEIPQLVRITEASLTLKSDLTMNFYATCPGLESPVLSVTFAGKTVELGGTLEAETGLWKFRFEGILPQQVSNPISAELKAGGTVYDVLEDYSVKQYAENLFAEEGTSLRIKRLLVELLNYAALTQSIVTDFDGTYANAGLTDGQQLYGSGASPVSTVVPSATNRDKWQTYAVLLDSPIAIRVKTSYTGVLNVSVGGTERGSVTITDGYAVFKGITAGEFDSPIVFSLPDGSDSLTVSINSYLVTLQSSDYSGTTKSIGTALYRYGAAAREVR